MSSTQTCCKCGAGRATKPKPVPVFLTQCKHQEVCMPCGTEMCKNKAVCPTCGATTNKLLATYTLRAAPSRSIRSVAKFPGGLPALRRRKRGDTGTDVTWTLNRQKPEGGDGATGPTASSSAGDGSGNCRLEDSTGRAKFTGVREAMSATASNWLMFEMRGDEFLSKSVGEWYSFRADLKYNALTLEEAEDRMRDRNKQMSEANRFEKKVVKEEQDVEGDQALGLNQTQKSKKYFALPGDESDDDDESNPFNQKAKQRKTVKNENEFGDGMVDDEKDWEHEGDHTDDDEDAGDDLEFKQTKKAGQEENESKWHKFQEKLEEADPTDEDLSAVGRDLKKIIKRNKDDEDDEDDDEDEEDDDEDLDEDDEDLDDLLVPTRPDADMDEDIKPNIQENVDDEDTLPAAESMPSMPSIAPTPPPAEEDPEPSNPIAAAGASAEASAPAVGVSADKFRKFVKSKTNVTIDDILTNFKKKLKSTEAKTAFRVLLKQMGKVEAVTQADGTSKKVYVLK